MFSKKKSKEILKFKYLWLIPVLMGMLVYTSCENTEPEKGISKVNEKRLVKLIMGDGDKVKRVVIKTKKEGYFDFYLAGAKSEGKEISVSDLSSEEKIDYEKFIKRSNDQEDRKYYTYKLFEFDDGTRAVQEIIDWKTMKKSWKNKDYSNADVVPFARIDQVPVYPGCEDADNQKNCMIKKITEFVNSNFDTSLSKNLGLEAGKKRVYVQFEIDKTGKIVNVRARGPHEALEKEAVRVVSSLPAMQPGENNGKKVGVKYTLPITLVIE